MTASRSSQRPPLSLGLALLVTAALGVLIALAFLLISAASLLALGYRQVTYYSQLAGAPPLALAGQAVAGWLQSPTQTNSKKNVLILGLDYLPTRGEAVPLTDSILLASVDLKTGKINLLSLPRDLWLESVQARINSLYSLGLSQTPTQPLDRVTQEIETLTSVPIHHTVILSLETVAALIDQVGGVEVDVQHSFIDYSFPRTDVDVTVERDPAKLYETVAFQAGKQRMDGQTALKFMRSRKSQGLEGNDEARSQRQQLVIQSLFSQLANSQAYKDPATIARLYAFYTTHFSNYIPVPEAIATAKVLLPVVNQVQFKGSTLSIFPSDPQGVIFHPPENTTNGAWVYKVRNLPALQKEVQNKLETASSSGAL